jgi:hypothetical protein
MEPDRLDQILKQQGKTRAHIQTIRSEGKANAKRDKNNDNTLDKKTVIKINKGEAVSIGVLTKLANRLEIDIQELVPSLRCNSTNDDWGFALPCLFTFDCNSYNTTHCLGKAQNPVHGDWANEKVLKWHRCAKLESAMMLKSAVKSASKVRYELSVQEVSEAQEEALKNFSTVISELPDLKKQEFDDTDLLLQIESVKKQSKPSVILDELKELGLHVYILKYYEYDRELMEMDARPIGFEYTRTEILAIGIIDHIPEGGVAFFLDTGTEIFMEKEQIAANLDNVFGNFDSFLCEGQLYERSYFSTK